MIKDTWKAWTLCHKCRNATGKRTLHQQSNKLKRLKNLHINYLIYILVNSVQNLIMTTNLEKQDANLKDQSFEYHRLKIYKIKGLNSMSICHTPSNRISANLHKISWIELDYFSICNSYVICFSNEGCTGNWQESRP